MINYSSKIAISLFFILQVISGCVTTISKDTDSNAAILNGRTVFQDNCSKCHELPDIGAYPYSQDDWAKVVGSMLETKEADQYISIEDAEMIKNYISIILEQDLLNNEGGL